MRSHTNDVALLAGMAIALAGACGDGSAGQGEGDGGAWPRVTCARACALPDEGPCADADEAACLAECEGAIEGLEEACAQCIIRGTLWEGTSCACDGDSCEKCFDAWGVGGSASACVPTDDCTGEEPQACTGHHVPAQTAGSCAEICPAPGA
jgi:hypothetical protein